MPPNSDLPARNGVSEQSYRTIFDSSYDAMFVHDLETGAILDANRAASELAGATHEELLTRGIDIIGNGPPPFTADEALRRIAQAAAGAPQRFEWCAIHPHTAEPMWVEVGLQKVSLQGQDRLLAVVRDIRERKKAEQALRQANEELERRVEERTAELAEANMALEEEVAEHEAAREQLLEAERTLREREEHFRRLIESSHDLIQTLDVNGRITYSSPSVQRMLGYSPEEVTSLGIPDFLHPDDQPMAYEKVGEAMSNPGRIVELEYRVRHRDGSYRWMNALARTLSPDTAEHGLVGNARDVTEQRAAQEALRRSEEHFRSLIESSSDYIMLVDTTAAITYVSPSSERLLGWTPAEMLGARPQDLVHPDDLAQTLSEVDYIIAHPGEIVKTEYRIRHRDGSYRDFESVARTLAPDCADEGIVVNCRDVTERRAAEAALREAREAAERANQAKSEFLSRMSHELRTPMNSILGFAQVLETGTLDERQERCVQHILRAGHHLLQLINEVLEISRIEAGRHNLSLEPVRVAQVVDEAVALARPLATQARVEVELDTAGTTDLYVRADRQRLSQVVLNLLSNAIKYNRAGGRVRVQCALSDGDGARLRIRVSDTGRGIPHERQAELFTPFARLGIEASGVEGTGLGLALSQRLAEAMDGTLTLERTSGEGSVFLLELLVTPSQLQRLDDSAGPVRAPAATDHTPATLLYIEDNLANLSLIETILWERPNWRTIPALQGEIGLELAREHEPDLILLDLHLPDVSGEEVLRRLRADERTARIPVIVISADATPATAERLHAAGALDFLTKPIDVGGFLAALERHLAPPTP